MRQLRQRVGLVHELRKLTAAEELPHRGHHRPRRADQPLWRDRLRVLDRHPLSDTALKSLEPRADMHLDQLADRTNAAVAEVVDIVRLAEPIAESDHLPNDLDQILSRSESGCRVALPSRLLAMQALVQLIPADPRQVVSPVIEEQVLQHRARVVARRRVAWPQSAVKLDQGLIFLVVGSFSSVVRRNGRSGFVSTSANAVSSSSSVSCRWLAGGSSPASCACGRP